MEIENKLHPRLSFLLVFGIFVFLAALIVKPFLLAGVTGVVIAILSYPFYHWLRKGMKSKVLAALCVTLTVMLIFLLPIFTLLSVLSQEATMLYNTVTEGSLTVGTDFEDAVCQDQNAFTCRGLRVFLGFLPNSNLDVYLDSVLRNITSFITENFNDIILSLPFLTLNFFVMLFVVYYTLKDNKMMVHQAKRVLPLKPKYREEFVKKFKKITFAVLYGNVFVAIIQGAIAAIGYTLFNVESPLFWGAVTIVAALIPLAGSAIIWLPLSLNFLIEGYLAGDPGLAMSGVGLFVYGLLLVATIDNFLRPRIIGTTGEVHPIVVLLGVLGGLQLFGFMGIIVGPVVLAFLLLFVEVYGEERGDLGSFLGLR